MANATIIYACTPEGLAILTKPGTLPEWLPPRRVLGGQPVTSAWGEPGPPIRVLAVAGSDLLLSESGGRNWERVELGTPITNLFSFGEDSTIYAATEEGGLLLSHDSGATWSRLPPLPERGRIVALLPNSLAHGRAYALVAREGSAALLEGNPADGEWRTLLTGEMRALSQDSGTGNLYTITTEGVGVSSDGGETWELAAAQSPQDGACLLAIPGAASKPPALVVGAPGGVVVSPDGGATWGVAQLREPGGVTALARDPERRDRLYAATDGGFLFESANRGQAWQPINAAPLPPVSALYVIRI